MKRNTITIVSGLPRSGTSLMMMMLEAGGMPVLTDHIRTADADNPKGYYEFERVKAIERDQAWLKEAGEKTVKMVSALLKHLPQNYAYRIIFMRREMEEILASQRQMLIRRGEPTDTVSDERIAELSNEHLQRVATWIDDQPNIDVLYVSYNEILKDPLIQARRVADFVDIDLNVEKMSQVVDSSLYRQRHGD
ncbi:MAG: sulfotransferase [Candidatus Bipolaricaulota bacterium]|nr:sulfotransferase [Candidatus Bipolaricaulota bacterium]